VSSMTKVYGQAERRPDRSSWKTNSEAEAHCRCRFGSGKVKALSVTHPWWQASPSVGSLRADAPIRQRMHLRLARLSDGMRGALQW